MLRNTFLITNLKTFTNILQKNVVLRTNLIKNYGISTQKFIENVPKPHITSKLPQPNTVNSNLNEKEYSLKVKHNPDEFGRTEDIENLEDEGDIREEEFFTEQPDPSQKLSTKKYADIIKNHIRKLQINEAIEVLEVRMIKEDRVKPENYIYNLLLGACGRVGYTKKAFSLYNQMKERALRITGGTYTALFNACANSPFPEHALKRAHHLREIMIEKMYEPNETNYNAMIKAFGRCGDLKTAFEIADEMTSKQFKIKADTICFLLQSCISDKEAGFRHSLLVWRKSIDCNIKPTLFMYNLILRCIRDCGIGDIQVTEDVIKRLLKPKNEKLLENKHYLNNSDTQLTDLNESTSNLNELTPNLLAQVPHLGNIISFSEITKPEHRLLLVGGLDGFLANMKSNKCTPDIKTYTQLLDNIPSTLAAEQNLLKLMKNHGIKLDVDFLNMLMKKRAMRFDYENAKEVLKLIKKYNFKPNLISYGILALGCKTKNEALEMLEEMNNSRYRLNIEILGAMLSQACYHKNISYVLEIMEIILREEIEVDQKCLDRLQKFKQECRRFIKSEEAGKQFEKDFMAFRMRLRSWLNEIKMDESENVHPWKQFQQNADGNRYKDKNIRFKAQHTSLFKVKTSTKHLNSKQKNIRKKKVKQIE